MSPEYSVPPRNSSGEKKKFTSITIHDHLFQEIKTIADRRGDSSAKFIEKLVRYYMKYGPLPIEEGSQPEETTSAYAGALWANPYKEIILDSTVVLYRSTAWIRSKEYVVGDNSPASPQWGEKVMERLHSDRKFRIEKVFVVSEEAWSVREVWDWISLWFMARRTYKGRVECYVVRQKEAEAKGIDKRFFDMGIYGDQKVGYLDLDERSVPQKYYTESLPKSSIGEAINQFEKLKKASLSSEDIKEKLMPLGF